MKLVLTPVAAQEWAAGRRWILVDDAVRAARVPAKCCVA